MSRDYKARKSKTSNGSKGGMLVGIFIGYALGVASAIGMWFYLESAPSPFLSTEQISAFDQSLEQTDKSKRNEGEGSKSDSNPAAKMEQKTQFDFYNILSNEKTDIFDFETLRQAEKNKSQEQRDDVAKLQPQPQTQSQSMISPAPVSQNRPSGQGASDNYYLQVGSFRNHNEADNLKARLALLGLIASVQSADLAEKGTWYRVRVGPFSQKAQVDNVHVTLRENGIDAQLIRIR